MDPDRISLRCESDHESPWSQFIADTEGRFSPMQLSLPRNFSPLTPVDMTEGSFCSSKFSPTSCFPPPAKKRAGNHNSHGNQGYRKNSSSPSSSCDYNEHSRCIDDFHATFMAYKCTAYVFLRFIHIASVFLFSVCQTWQSSSKKQYGLHYLYIFFIWQYGVCITKRIITSTTTTP